jgi:hypothetical protein
MFRVLAWDETNHAVGQTVDYPSLTDPTSVFLYIEPDPEHPLLVDQNGDNLCDHVNTQGADGEDLRFLRLAPVTPTGGLPNAPGDFGGAPTAPSSCTLSTAANNLLCSSDMSYVIKHEVRMGTEPVIYASSPVAGNSLTCTGITWEVRGLAGHAGWVCMAAVATDVARNEGQSAPLRVCIDDDDDPSTSPCDGIDPPSCTDGCTPPPNFPSRVISYIQ